MKPLVKLTVASLFLLSACGRREGSDPAECGDEEDNDGDGLFDCEDPDCAESSSCDEYTLDEFEEAYSEAACAWAVECYPDLYADVASCIDEAGSNGEPCEGYDPVAAEQCVVGVQAMDCPAESEFPEFPTACADVCEMPDDTGDSCWYDEEAYLSSISYECSPATTEPADRSGTWTYSVRTTGLAGAITVEMLETGSSTPRTETHPLMNTAYDADCGTWDQWDLGLYQVGSPASVVSGQASAFGCAWDSADNGVGGSLAFKMTMFDDGNRAVDCAIWGFHSAQAFAGSGCVCFDVDADCSN